MRKLALAMKIIFLIVVVIFDGLSIVCIVYPDIETTLRYAVWIAAGSFHGVLYVVAEMYLERTKGDLVEKSS